MWNILLYLYCTGKSIYGKYLCCLHWQLKSAATCNISNKVCVMNKRRVNQLKSTEQMICYVIPWWYFQNFRHANRWKILRELQLKSMSDCVLYATNLNYQGYITLVNTFMLKQTQWRSCTWINPCSHFSVSKWVVVKFVLVKFSVTPVIWEWEHCGRDDLARASSSSAVLARLSHL